MWKSHLAEEAKKIRRHSFTNSYLYIVADNVPYAGDPKGADEMAPWSKRFLAIVGMTAFLAAGAANAQTYYVKPGDSLFTISQRFGITTDALRSTNRLTSTYIYPGQALTIPHGGGSAGISGTRHTVAYGDSLFKIAQRYGISVDTLRHANGLRSDQLMVGQVLTIPFSSGSSGTNTTYRVVANDSLFKIAQRYGITVEALRQANGLRSDQLMVGQVLTIPVSAGSGSSGANQTHTVRANDSLFKIAQHYGVTVDAIKQLNGIKSDVIWVGQILRLPNSAPTTPNPGVGISLTASERDLFARLVTAEAAGEPYEGLVAVAATVLNRIRDPRYPSTIKGVIYQVTEGRYYQYSPVLDGRINLPPIPLAFQAIDAALKGWDPSLGAVGFYNPAKTTNAWVRSHPVTTSIGLHVFFRN